MKYHIYRYAGTTDEGQRAYERSGEFTPAADPDNCWFAGAQLWTPETGFRLGQFKIGKYWLVSDDEFQKSDLE